ncbi:dihydrodipicolinate synthase family protein [Anditalea andensis]|uniref:Dihydrodipicolinate synthase/N-acetylneuraminate lyase n=1 Tax=Anditalea andensis TaxID=1048983 RepID=A0A074L304_9BACT|nr:dihydrodipicolinate synthase family protein [Anditalea andensis]KEO74248.1 dihydrodipicolinate synthase/N-acetylneuraminate lyase [Anditalea andensis]
MRTSKKFQGVVVPMITPLLENGKVDEQAVEKIMRLFADNDISPLVLGTTGEGASFSKRDSLDLVSMVMSAKAATQQIYVGLTGNQVGEQIELANGYLDLGVDAVVATLPSYYILTPFQMQSYFKNLADKVSGPVMIYNIKSTTQMSIPLDIIEELSQHPNIFGLKDSERDEERLAQSITLFKDRKDFSFFCGWGAESAHSLELGADGIVPSTGNLVSEMYKNLFQAAISGDLETSKKYQDLTDQVAVLYQKDRTLGQSLATLKLLMQEKGLCKPFMKAPLSMLDDEMTQQALQNWQAFQNSQE